jgi:hypothetical protein
MCAPPNLFPLPVSEFQDSAYALNNVRNDFIFPFRTDKIFGVIQAGQPCKTGNACCAIVRVLLHRPVAQAWSF